MIPERCPQNLEKLAKTLQRRQKQTFPPPEPAFAHKDIFSPMPQPFKPKHETPKIRGQMRQKFMDILASREPVSKSRLMALYEGLPPANQDSAVRNMIQEFRIAGFLIETIRAKHYKQPNQQTYYVYKGRKETAKESESGSMTENSDEQTQTQSLLPRR